MARWGLMLGGLIVWAVHFNGLYALASAAHISAPDTAGLWLAAMMGLSLACLAAVAGIIVLASKELKALDGAEQPDRFVLQVAMAGASLAALAIVFQTLAALIAD
ncbi:MAG: hypothetical protein B7Y99_12730 [Caulobacterales bacterium 32-69-10]|nr:MAG: hypothetical protein B7Y99_12730 [Caulobacterales bacterium 32-69-10]